MTTSLLNKRRSGWKIKESIARAVKYRLTNIRSHTRTSYELFNRHAGQLRKAGLIKKNGYGYEITDDGERFLVAYENLESLLRV